MDRMHIKISNPWFVCICLGLLAAMPPLEDACAAKTYIKQYLDGMEYHRRGQYDAAVEAFAAAISLNGREQAKVRYYGMRYDDYMPHRQKGICHYLLKQYQEAIEELELSIRQLPSKKAKRYLDLARTAYEKLVKEGRIEVAKTPVELKRIREAKSANPDAVGVVIGNRDYDDADIPTVRYAIRDAVMITRFLIKTFGYRNGNIILKTNATKGTLESIFGSASNYKGRLYDCIKPGKSDLFVYYSGHGASGIGTKKGYILPVDGNPDHVGISGYSMEVLYKNLSRLPTRSTIVVMDACFSGARLLKRASPVGIVTEMPRMELKNSYTMNSSTGTQISSWYPQKGFGLFTYYFLLGLTGDADPNDDHQISFKEISDYLTESVTYQVRLLYQGRKQTPSFRIPNGNKILVCYK